MLRNRLSQLLAVLVLSSCGSNGDRSPPTVIGTMPPSGTSGLPTEVVIGVIFNEPMIGSSVTLEAVPPIAFGAPSWNRAHTQLMQPAPNLIPGMHYQIDIHGQDLAGNPLALADFWFQTAPSPDQDVTRPWVVATSPMPEAVNVSPDARITVRYSEPMDPASMLNAMVLEPEAACRAELDAAGTSASCDAILMPHTDYRVRVGGSDRAGLPLQPEDFGFRTGLGNDTVPPTLQASDPVSGAVGVELLAPLVLRFSEPMDRGAVREAFRMSRPTEYRTDVMTWSADWRVATVQPARPFPPGTEVRWSLEAGARDRFGNPLAPVAGSYRLLRQATAVLPLEPSLVGTVDSAGVTSLDPTSLVVGRTGGETTRAFLSFDLSGLPRTLVRFSSATLSVYQQGCQLDPYAGMGSLLAQGVLYEVLDGLAFDAQVQGRESCMGPACVRRLESRALADSCAAGWQEVDAVSKLSMDWLSAARERRAEYRLGFSFDTTPWFGGSATLGGARSDTPPVLSVSYLVP